MDSFSHQHMTEKMCNKVCWRKEGLNTLCYNRIHCVWKVEIKSIRTGNYLAFTV